MESKAGLASAGMFFAIVSCLACWLSAFPTAANAQGQDSQGQNAVCTSTTGCSTTVGTNAFIDASVFAGNAQNRNLCSVLNYVLANIDQPPTYPNGAVIDAASQGSPRPGIAFALGHRLARWGTPEFEVSTLAGDDVVRLLHDEQFSTHPDMSAVAAL
jgi:hypothetical protein